MDTQFLNAFEIYRFKLKTSDNAVLMLRYKKFKLLITLNI